MTLLSTVSPLWVKFLNDFLPNRIKRLIFLSSLLAYIQGTKNPDEELVCKLNQLLQLSHSSKSAMVPSMLNERIWAGVVSRDKPVANTGVVLSRLHEIQDYKILTHQARTVSDNIIKNIPYWLKYGSNKQMRSDLVKLLTNVNKLSHG